ALSDPRSIVITEKMATKYFGDNDPIGKVMRYKNEDDLVVTGVIKDIPENSHLSFDFLLPIELQRQRWLGWGQGQSTYDIEKDWNWAAAWVYTLIHPGTDLTLFEDKLQAIANEHLNTDEQGGFSIEVQPLFDIHLKSNKSAEASANGNMIQLYSFGAIAVLILFIACVNFINLSSAQAGKRLNEVGLRKVMGARRAQLISQFFAEALILVSISATLALGLAYASLPYFNAFTAKTLSISLYDQPFFIMLFAVMFGVALLSGLRPSLAAVRVKAIQGIGNKFGFVQSKLRFNRAMVIVQFVICNLMIIGILVVNDQLDFLQNKDLGFDKEQMLILRHGRNLSGPQFEAFRNKLDAIPSVQNINRGYIAGTRAYTNTFKIVNDANADTYSLGIKWIGEGFTNIYGLEVIAGRNFDESSQTDIKSAILINEAAMKALGWSRDESIGNELSFLPGGASQPEKIRIIGVLADANFESLYDPVMPSVFRRTESSVGSEVSLKLASSGDLTNTLDQIETVWKSVIPEWPFEFSFLDDQIQSQYVKEERLTSAIQYFTILAIFIACLGLFGLTSFDAQQRTKEIGIRKVLGASIQSIFVLINKRFLWLIGFSLLLSVPTGYYLFNLWLQDFAYRIEIGPTVFLTAAIISLIITFIAVGMQSLKAASRDPSETLRYE
ncbi:MAG: FtsX-like permease family protein, partial [Bacteroidota bacterium]